MSHGCFFLIHNTISINIQALIDFMFIFRSVPPSMTSVANHQALPPTRSPRPHLTFEMDQIRQHARRYKDVTQMFIFSVYAVVANARL